MKVIIAEKPSVAREIATIVSAKQKKDGYIEGNGYAVTWAFGHLIQLAMPEEYGAVGFKREHLPIIPDTFVLKPRQIRVGKEYKDDPGTLKQLKVIQSLFNQCDSIIVATDAGREGELIFRYIYNYLACTKPFERLWISSLTEKAIREGLDNIKPGKQFDNLYQAAKTRSEADWLVGINASQSLSIAAGSGVYSLGRVQTPTLAMICKRFIENKNFVPTPFWQVKIHAEQASIPFFTISKEKYEQKEWANEVIKILQENKTITVESIEKKEVNQEPPLLYDLTTLQKEANSKHGFSADKTLTIAQKLYESKYITYPRTGSRYLSEDVLDSIPALINHLKDYSRFASYAQTIESKTLNTRSIDDKKVTDHHALIITETKANNLSGDDKIIYEMIAGRMLESFSEKCIKDSTTVVFACADTRFDTKGFVIKQIGWKAVFNDIEEKNENEADSLPEFSEGETISISKTELLEKQTKPKALHTESSLLSAMENAGKEIEDIELKASMKDCGIGTPATRAATIETLISRYYIKREKKNLIPTDKGLTVFDNVKDKQIADVEMTGQWENVFTKIESGEQSADNFVKGIEVYAQQITEELLNVKIVNAERVLLACPKCNAESVIVYPKVAKCNKEECGFVVFRSICGKTLSDAQIQSLLSTKKTGVIKGLKSKAGKSFDASLSLDDDYKVVFVFSDKKNRNLNTL